MYFHCASDCTAVPVKGLLMEVESRGNVFTVKATTLDMALWKIGGSCSAAFGSTRSGIFVCFYGCGAFVD